MKSCALPILLLLGTTFTITSAKSSKPWFCHDLDCPEYDVVEKNDDYEVREYSKGKWASTKIEGYLYSASIVQGFKRLFDYISGENEPQVKINMTAPVVTKVEHGDGPFCKNNFTISFFVPFSEQARDDTPKPSSKDVFIQSTPSATFFVSQYGGFGMDDITISAKAAALAKKLLAKGESFQEGVFFTAGYDPPFRLQNRHNEIWILKKEAQSVLTKEFAS
ncbi:SOUL heme-binding protein [Coccomyxa subellipsoidea C-169]|uniref:SOUL heme-binding protein n=1 Tax=Coccomyxa subellipsoidea (strain C-169) TaxID=574566 RepID=I0YVE6_COCSC|nr:SOUL heme-binding protein [Coccomyxa subellipsoidea C-169]EIE22365.1 SOUL heme-binding protein [Coccomyxa subellipsoidea C-169]|eukprot:XP_005646909.1 SOUL heme-binding protein [Coccomyxa subellipsoidea C-169]